MNVNKSKKWGRRKTNTIKYLQTPLLPRAPRVSHIASVVRVRFSKNRSLRVRVTKRYGKGWVRVWVGTKENRSVSYALGNGMLVYG